MISAVWLIVCLMSLAGIYVMLSAYFVAMVQVIVYAGAVLMLFLFVIMMLNLRTGIVGQVRNLGIKLFGLLILAVLMTQLRYVYKLVEPRREQVLADGFGQAEAIGEIIFSKYIFPVRSYVDPASGRSDRSAGSGRQGESRMMSLTELLILSGILFSLGVLGFIIRRNLLIMFMSVELILNSANLALVSFAYKLGNMEPQVIAVFVTALAAAEAAVGLAIVVSVYKNRKSVNVDDMNLLKW